MRVKITGFRNQTLDTLFVNVNPVVNPQYPTLKLTFVHINQQLGGCVEAASKLIGCDVEFEYLAAGSTYTNGKGETVTCGDKTHVDYKTLNIIRTPEMETMIGAHMLKSLAAGMLAAASRKSKADEDMC